MSPENLVDRFVEHLVRMQFDKAREFAELEKMRTNWADFQPLDERHWPAFMTVLAQLANLESLYFSLSYMLTKFSFRKENNIRDIYAQMRTELTRIAAEENRKPEPSGSSDKMSSVSLLASQFARFVSIRANLVEFYTLLPAKDWRAFDEQCYQSLTGKLDQSMDDDGIHDHQQLFMPCKNELTVLAYLFGAQRAIQECNALDALIALKNARDLLDDWFCSLDASPAAKPSGPSFFFAFTSRRRSSISRLGLLQFLLQFHHTMVAKFSLYFHDTLVHFAPHGEMKPAFSAPTSFLQLFHTFARKSNVHTICLLLNRIDQDAPFQGFGYHYCTSLNDSPREECSPQAVVEEGQNSSQPKSSLSSRRGDFQSGLSDKYPALLFVPTERRHDHSLYATICSFVQEGCAGGGTGNVGGGGTVLSTSSANLATESSAGGKIRYLFDKNKEQTFFTACVDGNIHLVVTFERRVQERESAVHGFFGEALGNLRCSKLFQEIRSIGK